jgi:regulator of sigma E protease
VSVGVAILALAVLVLLHEAGHFVVARAVGMTPRKFYLGFGPPLLKRVRHGVEYGIAVLPLGGYVKIPGMHRPAPGDLRRTLAPAEQAALGPQLDALDAALERGDEAAARAAARSLEPRLGENRLLQELEWSLAPDAYWRQRAWKKVAVIAAGPLANVAIAVVLFLALFMLGQVRVTRTVERVLPGHPAAVAGLRAGDRVLDVAGRPVAPDGISKAIDATRGRPFTIVVERAGRRVVVGPLRARLEQGFWRVGFEIRGEVGPGQSFPQALWSAVRVIGIVTSATVRSVAGLFVGTGTHDISSAVGVVRVTSQAFRQSLQDFLGTVGLVSLALGLLNLLPVLPLDGGHIVMSILERVRGRAFSQIAYLRYSAVGIALFTVLLYLGLRNDFAGPHG